MVRLRSVYLLVALALTGVCQVLAQDVHDAALLSYDGVAEAPWSEERGSQRALVEVVDEGDVAIAVLPTATRPSA